MSGLSGYREAVRQADHIGPGDDLDICADRLAGIGGVHDRMAAPGGDGLAVHSPPGGLPLLCGLSFHADRASAEDSRGYLDFVQGNEGLFREGDRLWQSATTALASSLGS